MCALTNGSTKGCFGLKCSENCKLPRVFPVLLALWLLVSFAQAKYSGGSGTEGDPYRISTAADMNAIGTDSNDWDKYFVVTSDIDMSSIPGTAYNLIYPFTGVFDGNNHTISNFSFVPTTGGAGLFGNVDGGVVKNLGLIDPNVDGGTDWAWLGSLAGVIEGGATISNCYVEGGNINGNKNVGGLVGLNQGTITDCYSTASVSGFEKAGGLVGWNIFGGIANSYSNGSVSGQNKIGGLVGGNSTTITNCYSTGQVLGTTDSNFHGGLVGYNYGTVTACYSTATVSGNDYVGGLVGYNDEGVIRACCSAGSVLGDYSIGGLVGRLKSGTIDNCYSRSIVSGQELIGGLVGLAGWGYTHITKCYATGAIASRYYGGGLVGWPDTSAFSSFWDMETSGQATSRCGTGLTTAEMQKASTFLEAGWDFVDETANGTEDIWWILEGQDYPRLWWETEQIYDF